MASWLRSFFGEIRPNLLYDITKWLVLAALSLITAGALYLYRSLHGQPRDLVLIGSVFGIAFLLMAIAFFIARIGRKKVQECSETEIERLVNDYVASVDGFADNRLKVSMWHLENTTDDIRQLLVKKMNVIIERDTHLTKAEKNAVQLEIAKEIAADSIRTEQLRRQFEDKVAALKAKGATLKAELFSKRR